MVKKFAVMLMLFVALFAIACGNNASVDPPKEEESSVDEHYSALEQAIVAFNALDFGALQVQSNYTQKHIGINGQDGSSYQSAEKSTIEFIKAGQNYNFIQMIEPQDESLPFGYKQENGVHTMYNYAAYDDGTFQWREGAAELDYYNLPEETERFTELIDQSLIDDILREDSGEAIQYTLILDEMFFDRAVGETEYNSYELKEYSILYFTDQNGLLERVLLNKSESWIQSEHYNVEQITTYDISLLETSQPVDLNYFKNSGTYKKPVYDEITEIWKEDFINIPETYILDVRVPKVKESLPNAEKINRQIEEDCAIALNATYEDLLIEGEWGGYPWHTVDFAVYAFDDIYQICIFNTEASAWGSGIGMWMYKYYYDIAAGDVVSQEDFLERMNYTQEDVLQIFYEDYLNGEDMGTYTYEEISTWYYFDENSRIQFYVNLFG